LAERSPAYRSAPCSREQGEPRAACSSQCVQSWYSSNPSSASAVTHVAPRRIGGTPPLDPGRIADVRNSPARSAYLEALSSYVNVTDLLLTTQRVPVMHLMAFRRGSAIGLSLSALCRRGRGCKRRPGLRSAARREVAAVVSARLAHAGRLMFGQEGSTHACVLGNRGTVARGHRTGGGGVDLPDSQRARRHLHGGHRGL